LLQGSEGLGIQFLGGCGFIAVYALKIFHTFAVIFPRWTKHFETAFVPAWVPFPFVSLDDFDVFVEESAERAKGGSGIGEDTTR
jgi:hypothetical protein